MRCPVCKAVVDQGPQCRRCRADLSLLFSLEEQRDRLLAKAVRLVSQGQAAQALAQTEQANELHANDDAGQLMACCHLWLRDFPQAWRCYARSRLSAAVRPERGPPADS